MTQLRERSHIILWLLLFFFIASMTVGGLFSGANILNLIFGTKNISINAGRINGKDITRRQYEQQRDLQINQMKTQGQEIDNRAYQTAGDFAWNSIIERELQNQKIKQLGLEVSLDEIYDFLVLTPPLAFQTALMNTGYFRGAATFYCLNGSTKAPDISFLNKESCDGAGHTWEVNNINKDKFDIASYQEAVNNGVIPVELNPLLVSWENYLRTWLADRKLRSLYNNLGSVSDNQVKRDFIKKNINCTIDYLYLTLSGIPDSLIKVSDSEIKERNLETKDDNYTTMDARTTVYTIFKPSPATNIKIGGVYISRDTLDAESKQDEVLQEALLFAEEAEYSSFKEAVEMFEIEKLDTLDIHEGFTVNSGIPFQMGVLRPAVRFVFDNSLGSISDPIYANNGIAIFHTIGEKRSGYKPMDEVKESIRRTLLRENKKDYAVGVLQPLRDLDNWDEFANTDSLLQYKSGETSTLGGSFPGIGKSNQLTGTLLAMDAGEISGVLETYNSVLILTMTSKDEFNDSLYQEQYTSIRDQLLNIERGRGFTNWLIAAKKSINIEDYRSEVY